MDHLQILNTNENVFQYSARLTVLVIITVMNTLTRNLIIKI